RVTEAVHDTPAALDQDFTPDVEQVRARPGATARGRPIKAWTRGRIGWTVTAVIFVVWAVWAVTENGTQFVALTGAGIAKGAIVALAALGFIVTMKATGIANFAQGDLITVGGYLGLWATSTIRPARDGLGLSLGLGYLLVLGLMFLLGIAIERVAYAPLAKK